MTDRSSDRFQHPAVAVGAAVVAYLPFTLLGYGTDVDVANVLTAGRRWLDDGTYGISRTPGTALHEVATARLDDIGGSVLVNLASVAFAALALWALHRLLRDAGSPVAGLAVLVLATNPWFWIAATSLGDFVWAIGLLLAGAVAARQDRRALAGVLFALAIGIRLSTAFLVLAWLLAERLGRGGEEGGPHVPRRATLVTGGLALVLGAVAFVPSWLATDRSLDFLQSSEGFVGVTNHLGRWGIKNVAFFGVLAGPVLLAGLPRLVGAWPTWRTSVAFRFGILAVVVAEVLYFRFPFKPLHLIPAAVGVALVVGHLGGSARRWLVVVVVAQLLGGVVTTTLAAPDVEDAASSGRIDLGLTTGPLLTDVRCRLDDRDDGPYPRDDVPAATTRSRANADCQHQTWRAG